MRPLSRRALALVALVGTLVMLPVVPADPASAVTPPPGVTTLTMLSQPGDYIGQGEFHHYTEADGTFSAGVDGGVWLRFVAPGFAPWWDVAISPADDRQLEPGPYEDATRDAFHSPTKPGVDVSGAGRGCNMLTGRFDLLELEYANDGTLLRLAVDIEQHCEGAAPALFVAVRYHASASESTAFPPPPDDDGDHVPNAVDLCPSVADPDQSDADLDAEGDECDTDFNSTWLTFDSDAGDWIGKGLFRTWHPADGTFGATAAAGDVRISYHGGQTWWDLEFAAPGTQPLAVGSYEGAMRAPFRDSSAPGLDVTGTGAGCNTLTGRFDILQLDVAPNGTVRHFAADFEQHCEGGPAALLGQIRYDAAPSSRRIAGADRIATAIEVSRDRFATDGADGVVLARSDDYADALAGTPLAAAKDAPILLTPSGELDTRVRAEIERVLPVGGTVHLLGGPTALSPVISNQLAQLGVQVVRHAGADRFATAVAVAEELGARDQILLVTGRNFPDGLTAGAAAANVGGVLLLTDGPTLPPSTAAYLVEHSGAALTAIGGPAAAAVPDADPIVGADRYETAVAVARAFFPSLLPTVDLASGEGFADALAGGVHAARAGAPLLLTRRTLLPPAVAALLRAHLRDQVIVLGGPNAVATTLDLSGI